MLSIYEDSKNRLWIGTYVGLNIFDKVSKEFKVYDERNGFPSNLVYGILEDDDGNLIDPFNGKTDLLEYGLLRTPLPANVTFMDDPLRILRALRFAVTKGFFIDDPLWDAMTQDKILEKLYS